MRERELLLYEKSGTVCRTDEGMGVVSKNEGLCMDRVAVGHCCHSHLLRGLPIGELGVKNVDDNTDDDVGDDDDDGGGGVGGGGTRVCVCVCVCVAVNICM